MLTAVDDDVQSCTPVRLTLGGKRWCVSREILLDKHVVVWRLRNEPLDVSSFTWSAEVEGMDGGDLDSLAGFDI